MPDLLYDILNNENFHKLPFANQLDFLRKTSPEFAAIDPKEQAVIINTSRSAVQPFPKGEEPKERKEDKGFLSTLGEDALGAVKGVAGMMPGHPEMGPNLVNFVRNAFEDTVSTVREAREEPNIPTKVGKFIAAAVPIMGPAFNQMGNELRDEQYGQFGAHAFENLLPVAGRAASFVPKPVMRGAMGAMKGAAEGAVSPTTFSKASLPGAAGYLAGHAIGGSGIEGYLTGLAGAGVGAQIPNIFKGAARGWKQGYNPESMIQPGRVPKSQMFFEESVSNPVNSIFPQANPNAGPSSAGYQPSPFHPGNPPKSSMIFEEPQRTPVQSIHPDANPQAGPGKVFYSKKTPAEESFMKDTPVTREAPKGKMSFAEKNRPQSAENWTNWLRKNSDEVTMGYLKKGDWKGLSTRAGLSSPSADTIKMIMANLGKTN